MLFLFRYILLNYRELLDEADIIELMASIANGWIIEDRTHNSTILIQSSYIEKQKDNLNQNTLTGIFTGQSLFWMNGT